MKPAAGRPARSASRPRVDSRCDLARALAYGGAFGRELLVEEKVDGGVYRLLYLDGELLDAVRRDSADRARRRRQRRIEQLIAARERAPAGRRHRGRPVAGQDRRRAAAHVAAAGHDRSGRVPPPASWSLLKNVVNDNRRDDNVSAADLLCAEVVEAGAEAAAAVGTRLAGVDIITPDPSVPLADAGGVVIEVNPSPGLLLPLLQARRRACRWPRSSSSGSSRRPRDAADVASAGDPRRRQHGHCHLGHPRASRAPGWTCICSAAPGRCRRTRGMRDASRPTPSLPAAGGVAELPAGAESEDLRGAVLLACNDDGLELLLEHRDELAGRYRARHLRPGGPARYARQARHLPPGGRRGRADAAVLAGRAARTRCGRTRTSTRTP